MAIVFSCPALWTTNFNSTTRAAVSRAIKNLVPSCPPDADQDVPTSEARPLHAELAHQAPSSPLIRRPESGGAAPGIDLLDRLAAALGTTAAHTAAMIIMKALAPQFRGAAG